MRITLLVLAGIAIFLLAINTLVIAQMTMATLSGMVTDETAAVLPGVQVTVVNRETGNRRAVTTDAGGRFVLTQLAPGPYEVIATISGFDTLRRSGITLAIGQEATVNMVMKVGTVTQQVEVTGEASQVNATTSSVSGVVEEKRIEDLPLNGRDFSQLPLVQPGVAAVRNGDVTVSKGYGARISMAGSRPDQTAWLLDGTNIHSPSNFGTPGSAAAVMLGVDAVREFQVLTSNYSADLGGTSGGVVNMISKSGTNRLHGTLYEYLRNSALDARNFFDVQKPAFKRNQFGGSMGGAIKKDRTFFFGNLESLRQRQGVTAVAVVPDLNAHQGLAPAADGTLQQFTIAPAIRPYLDLWPLPNGGLIFDSKGNVTGLANLNGAANSPVDETFLVVRGDHHISDRQTIFSRFTYDQGNLTSPDPVPIFSTQVGVHSRYVTLQHDFVISPQFLMTTRVAYNRTLLLSNEVPQITYPASLNIFREGAIPQFTLPGATVLGPTTLNMAYRVQNLYDVQENLQYIRGGHAMKFGIDITHIGSNKTGEASGMNGAYTWNTLRDFLVDNRLSAFNAAVPGSDTSRSYVQYIYGTYFQDDWKMRPNFTWNLGLRYEPVTAPTEKHGRISMVRHWETATQFETNVGLFDNPTKKNFSPRLGFAWDPKGNAKTAIRAGIGMFYADLLGSYYQTPGQKNPPFFGSTATVQGNFTTSLSDMARIGPSLLSPTMNPNDFMELIQWNLKPSYELKFNVSVERQLPGDLTVTLGYIGDRGVHLWRLSDVNDSPAIIVNGRPFVPANTPRLNPHTGVGTIRYSDAQSFYNGMQLEVKKRLGHGFQFQTSYTWSKNVDDSTSGVALTDYTPGGNGNTQQPYNPKADRGLSSLHIGQSFVLNGIYSIPSPTASGFVDTVFGGWQISNILTANSGVPFTVYISGRNAPDQSRSTGVQRPDLVAGRSFSSMVTGNPNQYFDPTAFVLPPTGFYGNAGRDILTGPSLINFDFSVTKRTKVPIRDTGNLEFHADFFNLFNRANFAVPRAPQAQVLNPASPADPLIGGAGKITNTVTNSRQIQFGLKLVF